MIHFVLLLNTFVYFLETARAYDKLKRKKEKACDVDAPQALDTPPNHHSL